LNRRSFLQNSSAFAALGATGLTGCARHLSAPQSVAQTAPALPFYDAVAPIIPIRAHVDRIFQRSIHPYTLSLVDVVPMFFLGVATATRLPNSME